MQVSVTIPDRDVDQSRRARVRREATRGLAVGIAGVGLISPLGDTAEKTWNAILRGEAITEHTTLPKEPGPRSRAAQLAIRAAREATADARWTDEQFEDVGLVVGTSKGAIVNWLDERRCGSGVGDVAADVACELGIRTGPRLTVSAACASGLHALIRGVLMIKAQEAKRVLVVAAEASVHELFLASFKRLGVLARPGAPARPFDQNRDGFLMSEAAAAVCLEVDAGNSSASNVIIERMAIGGDATHLVGGDPDGQTLGKMLDDVLDGRPIDLVHAHGTATPANDAIELNVIERCVRAVGGLKPALYSHKGALGHSLGAAGLMSVVLNRLCHQHGLVPPAPLHSPMPTSQLTLSRFAQRRPIRRSIAMAAGFGGAAGVVSLVSD